MAKIYSCIFGILLLCVGCHRSLPKDDIVDHPKQVLKDSSIAKEVVIIDSVPVVVTEKNDSIVALAPVPARKDSIIAPPPVINPPAKKSLTEIYLSQIGVRELTGNNDGKDVEKYLRSVGLGKGYAWCAAFVRWCMDQAGIKTKINGAAASCLNMNNLVLWKHEFRREPKSGDVGVLWFNSLNRIAHTFFYHRRINSSMYESVEGNTSEAGSRDGDGVYKMIRSFNATYGISSFQ